MTIQIQDVYKRQEEEINLKKIYNKYFKRKTTLYEEIINWETLEKNSKQMNKYIEKVREDKNTYFYREASLIKESQLLIRDTYKFIFMNGISTNFSEKMCIRDRSNI